MACIQVGHHSHVRDRDSRLRNTTERTSFILSDYGGVHSQVKIDHVNIELPRSLYLKMQHGLYISRSSQPRPRLSLSSQKHHGAEPIYLNTLLRLWWSTLSS